jgi:pyruvate,orthophosphate dikinase
LRIDPGRRSCLIDGTTLPEVDFVSLDGNTGAVHADRLALLTEKPERALEISAAWRHGESSKRPG